jgi:hypothetical protein
MCTLLAGYLVGLSVDPYNSLVMLLDNSILPQLLIQHAAITQYICCIWPYWLFWNPCFSFHIFYFRQWRQSIMLLWAWISTCCITYLICKSKNCRKLQGTQFYNSVTKIYCTVSSEQTAIALYINYCPITTLWLDKIQPPKSWTSHGYSFPEWGYQSFTGVFALNSGQYIISGCLQPVTIWITQHTKGKIIDASLILNFGTGRLLCCILICLSSQWIISLHISSTNILS